MSNCAEFRECPGAAFIIRRHGQQGIRGLAIGDRIGQPTATGRLVKALLAMNWVGLRGLGLGVGEHHGEAQNSCRAERFR